MQNVADQTASAAEFIRSKWQTTPRVAIILGSGLGSFADSLTVEASIPYTAIPHFPSSTAMGHRGQLVCGRLADVPVVAMQGRFHLYEGYSAQQATLPVRVMHHLGAELLIVSNASGGLNPAFGSGDVMLIEDQINLTWKNPLIGPNDDRLGPRFPDMSSPYDPELLSQAANAARRNGFDCHLGVYAAFTGPTYETRAEYRMLRHLGADVVGMSTVIETIVARHIGMRVLGLSAVTNLCRPDTLESTSGQEVIAAAELAEPRMRTLVSAVVSGLE